MMAWRRLCRESTILRDGGDRFEGCRWEFSNGSAKRKRDGWVLNVYYHPIERVFEARWFRLMVILRHTPSHACYCP
jgi:hypothetical protein